MLKRLWLNFVSSGFGPEHSRTFLRRVKFSNTLSLFGLLFLFSFGVIRMVTGQYLLAAVDIFLGLILTSNLLLLRRAGKVGFTSSFGSAGVLLFLFFLFITGGTGGTGLFWFYFYPVLIFFLFEVRIGLVWMAALYLGMGVLCFVQSAGLMRLFYPFSTTAQMMASLLLESIMVFFYANVMEREEGMIERSNQQLINSNQALQNEIIQRQRASVELLRIRQAVNSLGDAVVIADAAGRHIFHNPAFFQMFGYSLEEVNQAGGMGSLFSDPQAGHRLMENLRKGQGFSGEVEMHNKEGRRRAIEIRADAIRGADGVILGQVAVQVDITRHMQAEKDLKQSEERFRQVIGSISSHIYVTRFGPEGTPENDYLSPNVAALTGYPLEMFTEDWSFWPEQLIQPQDRETAREQVEKFKRGQNSESEYRITKKDSSVIWVRDSGRVERNRQTGEITVYGVISDISQSKCYEEVREALLADVRKVNAELADFAYIVSHDLKAPLRAISSLAAWLAEDYADKIDTAGKQQLQLLLKRTKRMHNLIEGILAYSRLGRIKPVLANINSRAVAESVVESLASPDNIRIIIDGNLPQIVYDPTHLEQLIQNLCSNAIKHLGKPKGQVTIACSEIPGFWEFCIRDDGVGIDPIHFDRIFKIFQTLKPRDEVESTGIGLTIVKKTVELYGGKVRLESVPGQGAAFFFTVPQGLKPDPEHY